MTEVQDLNNAPDERIEKYAPLAQDILKAMLKHNVTLNDRDYLKRMVKEMWMNYIAKVLVIDIEEAFEIAYHSLHMNYQRALEGIFEAHPMEMAMGDLDRVLKAVLGDEPNDEQEEQTQKED